MKFKLPIVEENEDPKLFIMPTETNPINAKMNRYSMRACPRTSIVNIKKILS